MLALLVIAALPIGIQISNVTALMLAVVAIGFANAVIRPIIMFFAWPLNCLTFGLMGFAVNVLLFNLVGSGVVPGFHVRGVVPALIGTVAMSFLSGLFNFVLKDKGDRDA